MFCIAICDDDIGLCTELEKMLYTLEKDLEQKLEVEVFYSGEKLCSFLKEGKNYDLILLDVEFETMNGIEVGHFIRTALNDFATSIIYISNSNTYVEELFANKPDNFLRKPIDRGKLLSELKKVIDLKGLKKTVFEYVSGKKPCRIEYGKIMYFSSTGRKVNIHTIDGVISYYAKLSAVEKQAAEKRFLVINKSFLVNQQYIESYKYTEVTLKDGTKLGISQTYRKSIRQILMQQTEDDIL